MVNGDKNRYCESQNHFDVRQAHVRTKTLGRAVQSDFGIQRDIVWDKYTWEIYLTGRDSN